MDFIELIGASGTAYRFRRWPGYAAHPPIAGNFALVVERTKAVLALGVADDLSRVREQLGPLPRGAAVFTRFNVARRLREAEQADIALQHPHASEPDCEGADSAAA